MTEPYDRSGDERALKTPRHLCRVCAGSGRPEGDYGDECEACVAVDAKLVYVAGASAEYQRAARFSERLRKRGHRITYDWPASVASRPEASLTREEREATWIACLDAVRAADVVIALGPSSSVTVTRGLWAELGACQAEGGVPIYVGREYTIVTAPCECVPDEDAAIEALEGR